MYSIDAKTGVLSQVQEMLSGGIMPRNFEIDPTGRYLLAANQLSQNVVVFSIDQNTGKLEKTGKEIKAETPVCLKFVSAGH